MSETLPFPEPEFPPDKRRLVDVLQIIEQAFTKAGIDTALLDARLLVQHGLDMDHAAVILKRDWLVGPQEIERLIPLVIRRLKREPVARIVGQKEFWSLPFFISPATLDPRPDTETLIEVALSLVGRFTHDNLNILDLGTGSGCILLSLLSELPEACGVGVDLAPGALKIAEKNAQNLNLSDRSTFIESDWFTNVEGQFDLIVANPPYIANKDIDDLSPEVALYDPHRALEGGDTGLEAYARILARIHEFLSPRSALVFECGFGQAQAILALIEASPVAHNIIDSSVKTDLQGVHRVVAVEIQRFAGC